MTNEEIEKILAGRELDILIEEKVMGRKTLTQEQMRAIAEETWKIQPFCQIFGVDGFRAVPRDAEAAKRGFWHNAAVFEPICPRYSTDIAAAWQVVGKLRKRWPVVQLQADCDGWCAEIHTDEGTPSYYRPVADAYADTAPLAICRAALKAVTESPDPFFERPGVVKGLEGCGEMEAGNAG